MISIALVIAIYIIHQMTGVDLFGKYPIMIVALVLVIILESGIGITVLRRKQQ